MNERRQDFGLLREFARKGDQAAFASIVRRHVNLVYGTALRKLEDPGAAEEVAQNVFAALARKAWRFAPDNSLPAWLYRTTLLEAEAWLRGELRRRRREQTAAELNTTMKNPDEQTALHALVPLLDEALLALHEKDRTALLVHYYESQSLRSVGASLGVSEDAAQKRVSGALAKLVQFFQRRGFKTVTIAATTAALEHTATTAPALVAASIVQAASQVIPPAIAGLTSFLARFASLTRIQAAGLTVALAAASVAWQGHQALAAERKTASMRAQLEEARGRQEQLPTEIERLRAESAKLDAALAEATKNQVHNQELAGKLEALKARIHGLLTDANYRWPDDLPYVRIPKSIVRELDLQHLFGLSGAISERGLEFLAITPEEKIATERALENYGRGAENLMAARAYETNMPNSGAGRITKTVIVPPLGQELKTLAHDTHVQITQLLGTERGKILFGGNEEGAIQIFSPGNLWKISEEPQNFTVWIDPAAANTNGPAFGANWSSTLGGTGTKGSLAQVRTELDIFPKPIAELFEPWLRQLGFTNSSSLPDHE